MINLRKPRYRLAGVLFAIGLLGSLVSAAHYGWSWVPQSRGELASDLFFGVVIVMAWLLWKVEKRNYD